MTHGAEAVHELVAESGLSYPVTTRQIEREHSMRNIDIDRRGNSIMVAEVLARTNADRFADKDDLIAKLEPVFEEEREKRSAGIVGRIVRALFGP